MPGAKSARVAHKISHPLDSARDATIPDRLPQYDFYRNSPCPGRFNLLTSNKMSDKIGIISDTHDNIPNIEQAVRIFNREKVSLVIHAGDYIAPFALRPFAGLVCEYTGVFGNNDGEKQGLARVSEGRIKNPPLRIHSAGREITVVHDVATAAGSDDYDILICGHTHLPRVDKKGDTLVLNPGECGGWLKGRSTIAILDPVELTAEIIDI